MHYVMSDIHGQYNEYQKMIKLINLKEKDILYILGDVIDRGPHPIQILQDMMKHPNIIPIIGNHEYLALLNLPFLFTDDLDESLQNCEDEHQLKQFSLWLQDGGSSTFDEFMQLSLDEKKEIINYLNHFLSYEKIIVNGIEYILVHSGLNQFSKDKHLNDYPLQDLLFDRPDYSKIYFDDKILVTGHTPTQLFNEENPGFIFCKNHHLAIDCGCVFGGRLAAYCFETCEAFYIDSSL